MPEGEKHLFLHILQKSVGYQLGFCLHPVCPVLPGVMKPSRPAGHITRQSVISRPQGISRAEPHITPTGHITRRSLISRPQGISRAKASYHAHRAYHEAEPHITPHRAYHEFCKEFISSSRIFAKKTHKLPPRVKLSPYLALYFPCRGRRPRRPAIHTNVNKSLHSKRISEHLHRLGAGFGCILATVLDKLANLTVFIGTNAGNQEVFYPVKELGIG